MCPWNSMVCKFLVFDLPWFATSWLKLRQNLSTIRHFLRWTDLQTRNLAVCSQWKYLKPYCKWVLLHTGMLSGFLIFPKNSRTYLSFWIRTIWNKNVYCPSSVKLTSVEMHVLFLKGFVSHKQLTVTLQEKKTNCKNWNSIET